MRRTLLALILLASVGCSEDRPDIDFEALELARRACIDADGAVERLDDDLDGAIEDVEGKAIAGAQAAAGRDDAYLVLVADVQGLHDVMLERDYNASGIARSYRDVSEVCRAVNDRTLLGQED